MTEFAVAEDSRDWFVEPRGWRDVLYCLLGWHKPITQAFMGKLIERCSCGAVRIDQKHWFEARPWTRR
jgi:hypothetical protein